MKSAYVLLGFTILLALSGCSHQFALVSTQDQQYQLKEGDSENQGIDTFIKPYRDSLDQLVNEVLAHSEAELTVGRPGKDLFP